MESRSRFWLWAVVLLLVGTVILRVGYVWSVGNRPLSWADESAHDEIGWKLACTGRYESSAYRATPVEPVFLALVYRVCGHDYRAARFCQAIIGGILLVLSVVGIGTVLFNRASGLVAGVITSLYPPLLYMSGVFYAEFLLAVLLAMTVFCLVRWQQVRGVGWLLGGGLLVGLSALCRPIALSVIPVAAFYVGWWAGQGRRLRTVALLLGAAAAVVLPWTARNAVVFRHFLLVSSGKGLHLWRGNNAVSQGDADDRHLSPQGDLWKERVQLLAPDERDAAWEQVNRLCADLEGLDEVEADRRLGLEGRRWLMANPGRFVLLSVRRLVTLYSAFTKTITRNETADVRVQLVAAISFYPVFIFGLAGSVLAWRSNRASWILHGVIVAVTLAYLPMTACSRFRLPLDVFWILLASLTVVKVFGWLKRRRLSKTFQAPPS